MLLSSTVYFVFLTGLFLLYWPLQRWRVAGLSVLLFANYFFYAKWDLFYLILIPGASFIDYLIGRGLGTAKAPWLRRTLVSLSVFMNLGILATFKYMPFFLATYAGFSQTKAPVWHWTFPLGISFYCFQSLTYTIDLYRKDGKPVRSLLTHMTAVSFFPTTLSGPITRVLALAPQLEKAGRQLSSEDGGKALFRIGLGLMKKFLIADYLAENLVNRVFDTPNLYTGMEALIGVYAYALQLYYDFSGYSDIAIGSALLLGLKLPENFNRPYLALNISEFWRRWHISLSNWLRDYLYFSLPGLRSKWKVFTYFNLFFTMLLGGLWHGASWNFVIWGALHGAALAFHHGWRSLRGNKPASANLAVRVASRLLTTHFVILAWVFFRASTLENAMEVLARIASLTVSLANISMPIAVVLLIAAIAHYLPKRVYEFSASLYIRSPFFAQAAALAALVLAIQYVAVTGAAPFLYTKF
ncbi:MAG TPA: MBOAT family O-acyltransferase [Paludibaculum sp.]|jgi:D-alanyl-lipoteichoic acid acyltransferase DltB (MBOAT superfamily)